MRLTKIKRRKRAKTHGFRSRQRKTSGRRVLARRRTKKRKRLVISVRRS